MTDLSSRPVHENKIAILILAVLFVVIIVAWVASLSNKLSQPFSPRISNETTAHCVGGDCPAGEEDNLKLKDTDRDGLSDWDEINVYNTSPYLEDTDSDGIGDQDEVRVGMDPYCVGEDCGAGNMITDIKMEVEDEEGEDAKNDSSSPETDLSEMDSEQGVELLREALIQAGMEKELLDQISDEALITSYYEILSEQK